MVFDNVEDQNILDGSKPITGDGTILVTCRSEFIAASICGSTLKVPTFTAEEGSNLLFKVIGHASPPSSRERECSLELAERLGGLALALDIMGKQIRTRKKTIEEFLDFYNEHRRLLNKQPKRGIRNQYYWKDLDTVWETSFLSLSQIAANLLCLICFVAPEDIPDTLFTRGQNLPPHYRFLADPEG